MNIEGNIQSHTVTDDVILVKMVSFYTICYLVFISEVKLKVSCAKHGFWKSPKTVSILNLWRSFKPKQKTILECIRKMSRKPDIMAMFVSTLYDKNWPSHCNLKNSTYFLTWWRHRWRHGCVTHNLHNEVSPPIFPQNIVCVAPVLHS